jgi:hypothetical protein
MSDHLLSAWWLLPIFLGWAGGLLAWLVLRHRDRRYAARFAKAGLAMSFTWVASWMLLVSIYVVRWMYLYQ